MVVGERKLLARSEGPRRTSHEMRDGRVVRSAGGVAAIWELESLRLRCVLEQGDVCVDQAVSTADAALVIGSGPDTVVRIWDANTGRLVGELGGSCRAGRWWLAVEAWRGCGTRRR